MVHVPFTDKSNGEIFLQDFVVNLKRSLQNYYKILKRCSSVLRDRWYQKIQLFNHWCVVVAKRLIKLKNSIVHLRVHCLNQTDIIPTFSIIINRSAWLHNVSYSFMNSIGSERCTRLNPYHTLLRASYRC